MDGTTTDDKMRLPLDRFCNWVVEWFRDRLKQADFMSWELEVDLPPEGVIPRLGKWSEESMMQSWANVGSIDADDR